MIPISPELLRIRDSVHYYTVRRMPFSRDLEDLKSAATLALVKFCQSWDGEEDQHCHRAARKRIYGEILDELRRMDHVGRRTRWQIKKIKAVDGWEDKPHREIAAITGLSESQVKIAVEIATSETISIDDVQVAQETQVGFPVDLLEFIDEKDRVFLVRVFSGRSDELAAERGVSRARIHQIKDALIKKYRGVLTAVR